METVITESNFNEVIASDKPVLVDFWAAWCGPCRMLAPIVDEIASEYEGKVTVAKCNVDDCEGVASSCGIRNIPTLMYFKNGQLIDKSVGVVSRQDIESRLQKML